VSWKRRIRLFSATSLITIRAASPDLSTTIILIGTPNKQLGDVKTGR
jgi:hypothetical protein